MGDFAHITGLWQAVFRPFTSHLERSTRWYGRFAARLSAHIWKTRSDMGRRTYIEDCRGSMDVYEQAVGRVHVYRGGRVNAHEEVLSVQQELSGMGSMKKGGVFITGEFTVSPVTRAPASPRDRKRT